MYPRSLSHLITVSTPFVACDVFVTSCRHSETPARSHPAWWVPTSDTAPVQAAEPDPSLLVKGLEEGRVPAKGFVKKSRFCLH